MHPDDLNALADAVAAMLNDAAKESEARHSREIETLKSQFEARIEALEKREIPVTATVENTLEVSAPEITPDSVRDLIMPELTAILESGVRGIRERWIDLLKVRDEVARQIAEMPKPQDGKDAAVDEDAIVQRVVRLVPVPQNGLDGRDAPLVDEEALERRIIERLPPPRDGRDAAPVDEDAIVARVLEKIPTPKPGIPGERGEKGDAGPRGEQGSPGNSGERGERGIDGKDGRDGRDAKDGRDGERGRDAVEIQILDGIDESRSYPAGTYAHHKHGLVKVTENGLRTIVNGWSDPEWVQGEDDPRDFTVRQCGTDGTVIESKFKIPLPLYREIFKEGDEYRQGDLVTYGGSVWYARVDTKNVPRTGNSDWVLAVKHGRDGRDLRPEDPKPNTPVKLR